MKSLKTKKLNRILALVLTFMALAMGQTAWAASKTVTYTFTATYPDYNVNRWTLTFTPSNSGFGYSTGAKTATIENTSSTTGFTVNLDDGLQLTYKQDEGKLTFWGFDSFYLNHSSNGGNSKLTLTSSNYNVTHVKIAGPSGSALTGTASPWTAANAQLDTDVDMTTLYGGLADYRSFSATFPSDPQVFGQLTVTYGDPREYAITFNDAVNGQNGVTNTNPTSYNVTTNDFQITAPSRTGYTLSGTTYTDSQHPSATAVNLSQSPLRINRGEAATRKAITFNTTWTAHHYTVHYDANGGQGSMNDQAFTYDAAQSLTANAFTAPTDYVFKGWNTETDGSGTSYADQLATPNVTATNGATVTLYAQWRQVSGSCGTNAHWSYDDNGTLSITGTGRTDGFSLGNRPWEQFKDAITTVSIGDGITSIGSSAFYRCTNLATITGGNDLINVGTNAFYGTQWLTDAEASTTVVYLGHVAYCGRGVSGDATIADGTIAIADDAFSNNQTITSVTIPASVTRIVEYAFYDCYALTTVNILAATPPTLFKEAFYLNNPGSVSRTFNVRSAAYKTSGNWGNIYYHKNDYSGYYNFQMRVVSTLALPDGVTASAADNNKVTILGTTYYPEKAEITLSGLGAEHTVGGITYRSRATISYGNDQTLTSNADAQGQATFTMPDADASVTAEEYPYAVKYIDENGKEQTCTDFTVVSSDYAFGDYYGTATLGVDDATERWYVVAGTVNVDKPLSVSGNARLILCDGATLRVNADYSSGDAFHGGRSGLAIYGQAKGTGTLSVTNTGEAIDVNRNITINGGTIIATSTDNRAGIDINSDATLTINGGTISATGGIGIRVNEATLTQNGGALTATGSGSYHAGIYASGDINISNVNILGGTLNATGTDGAFGIYATYNAAVTLGWTNPTDRIYASSYSTEDGCTISVKDGQTLTDGSEILSGTITDMDKLNGKTLKPAIPYIDENGDEQWCTDYTLITSSDEYVICGIQGETHWYVVSDDVTINGVLNFNDDYSHLIVCDGAHLTVSSSDDEVIEVEDDLTIYGQSQQSGTLTVNGYGDSSNAGIYAYGNIIINGCIVTVTAGCGIEASDDITINRGTVNATGTNNRGISGDNVTINGGIVNATGTNDDWKAGIFAYKSMTLGWTNPEDRITANSIYFGYKYSNSTTIKVKDGQALFNGSEILSGILYDYNNGNPIGDLTKLNGKTLRPALILADDADNSSAIAANNGFDLTLQLADRTLYKDGYWNTLCLPFDVVIKESVLDGADVRALADANLTGDVLTLNFTKENDVTTIEAGKPYIIRWGTPENNPNTTLKDPVFRNATVKKGQHDFESTDHKVLFKGNYSPITWDAETPSILFVGAENKLHWPLANAHLNAFRAYFELADGAHAREFVMNFDGEETTGIISNTDRTDYTDKADAWYSLDGRKLDGKPNAKGMYIYKGRKVVIK